MIRRNIAAMLVPAAVHQRGACFVDDELNGFVLAEIAEALLPGGVGASRSATPGAIPSSSARWSRPPSTADGHSWVADGEPGAEPLEPLGFVPEATRFGLYRASSTSNCTSSP